MDKIYVAVCSLDDQVIRLVYIAEDQVEAAKERFFGEWPTLLDTGDPHLSVTFHGVPGTLAAALTLSPGDMEEWWLGDKFPFVTFTSDDHEANVG